jgi:glyoxylase-like metal-dependent hydrolase (beta-lactamase superfamily II)/ferredoxin
LILSFPFLHSFTYTLYLQPTLKRCYFTIQCINCQACSNFAPETFQRSPEDSQEYHVVHRQPSTDLEIEHARAALAVCPVSAIRVETLAERRHRAADKQAVEEAWSETDDALVSRMSIATNKPFPRAFLGDGGGDGGDSASVPGVYWTGHHQEASFGATPYLLQAKFDGNDVWIMVDTPKYSKSSLQAVTSVTGPEGPDYLFLTHVDDTADHGKWAEAFDSQQIFHEGDLGQHNWIGDETLQDVEILLSLPSSSDTALASGLAAFALDGTPVSLERWLAEKDASSNVIVIHTPGHSPGSICLYKRPDSTDKTGILFTGDTYGYTTRDAGHMTGFPKYGNDLRQQSKILKELLELDWQVIAPGHGHPRDYRDVKSNDNVRKKEMQQALEELTAYRR